MYIDKERFFSCLRKLNVNSESELVLFLDDYKYWKVIVFGFNWDFVIVGWSVLIVFDDFIF